MGTLINISKQIPRTGFAVKYACAFVLLCLFSLVGGADAHAQTVNDVVANTIFSVQFIPDLISGVIYLIGVSLGIYGVIRIKEHVDNPDRAPLRSGVIRLLIGGAFLAMPTVYQAMVDTIDGGPGAGIFNFQTMFGFGATSVSEGGSTNFNSLLENIIASIGLVPFLFSAAAYLIGLVFGVIGLLKVKAHVENPDQSAIKDALAFLLIGGAFFALPYIYSIIAVTISGGGGFYTALDSFGIANSSIATSIGVTDCDTATGKLGGVMCNIIGNTAFFPMFLDGMSYLFGLVMGFWALIKIRDHVINPQNTPITQGLTRLAAGGMFFTLPYVVSVIDGSVTPTGAAEASANLSSAGVACGGGASLTGLDEYLHCAVTDILGPMQNIVNYFAMLAGIVFIMIGISRLLKSEQDGPRGPGGMGTIMTFITGGVLLSFSNFITVLTGTLFNTSTTAATPDIVYMTGMAEKPHAEMVASAILKFMIIIGLISFARGIFIIRGVAEGNSQASMMAGVTHIIGGALAFNLGPLLNAVQETLGVSAFGITFS
jgi:hypothetical protein